MCIQCTIKNYFHFEVKEVEICDIIGINKSVDGEQFDKILLVKQSDGKVLELPFNRNEKGFNHCDTLILTRFESLEHGVSGLNAHELCLN